MGVYNNTRITSTDASERAESVAAWCNALDGVSAEIDTITYNDSDYIGAKVTIDGTNIEMFLGNISGQEMYTYCYIKNGDVYLFGPSAYVYGTDRHNIVLNSYIDVSENNVINCIFLTCTEINLNGYEIIYVRTTDGKYLIGYNTSRFGAAGSGPYVLDISNQNIKFEDVSDPARVPYTYSNMFPFYAKEGTVDFLNQAYFKNGNSLKSFTTDVLKECSTVSLLSTISLPSPLNNSIALGAHCIAPLDDEEVSE